MGPVMTLKRDTIVTHAGRDSQAYAGMINTPVFRGSTVLYPDVSAYAHHEPDNFKTKRYGIHGTPTTFALEEAVAELEGGHAAVALPSGLAAVAMALLAFARQGAHILVVDTVYGPTRRFCDNRLRPLGVEVEYYDPLAGGGIAALLRDTTAAVFCESPGSLTFEMQDIPAVATAAHARGVPVIADNTWATPYFLRPFELGVDVSVHAGTKYIVGHADVLMGLVVTNDQYWLPLRHTVADYGCCVSPDDCYLALRGLRTIGVRLRHQQESALKIAHWLRSRPEVARVLYPAIEGDPGHAIWKRDFSGAASVFSVVLKGATPDQAAAMIDGLTLFGIGASWGGYESLCVPADPAANRTVRPWHAEGAMIRLHVGLEDPDDLMDDLARNLSRISKT